MNIYSIIRKTDAEGPGNRFAIWVQGCRRHCKGCMLPKTWSFDVNKLYSIDKLVECIRETKDIEGVTILGGEPFEQSSELYELLIRIKELNLSTIVFTGYTIQDIKVKKEFNNILNYIDVLIDGEYIENMRNFDIPMIGSSNQRFHFLTDRYSMNDIPSNKFEIRIGNDGMPVINGMGDINRVGGLLNDI